MDTEQLVSDNIAHPGLIGNIQENIKEPSKLRMTIEPVIFAIYLAHGISENVLIELILQRTCEVQLSLNQSFCNELGKNTTMGHEAENTVQPSTSLWLMANILLQNVVPAISAAFLGPWSDQYGRKPVLLHSVAGFSLSYAIYIILAYIPNLHPAYLLIGMLPLSCLGGYVNLVAASFCYVIDLSNTQTRALRLGILEAFLASGSLVGFTISSYAFSAGQVYNYGFLFVFGMSGILCFLALLYTLFFIQESHNVVQVSDSSRKLLDWSLPLAMIRTCIAPRPGGRRAILLLGVLSMSTVVIVTQGESQINYLFTRFKFGWGLHHFNLYYSINKLILVIGCSVGCWLQPNFVSETYMAMLAFFTAIFQGLLKTVAASTQSYFMYIAAAVAALIGAVSPSVRAILSKTVDANDLGKTFALTSSVEAFVPLATGPLYVLIYNRTLSFLPGAVFLFSATIFTIAFIFMGVIAVIQRKQLRNEPVVTLQ